MSGLDVEAVLAADLSDCADAPSGDPIRVGMAMDFSDVVGFVDIPGSKVVPYVAELINCAGGINGSPVEVRVAEVGDDAALATQELLDWGAHFLIGPPFADFALPILQTTGGQVPLFVAASTEPTLADASINSYLVTFDDYGMSEAAARWALDEGITRAIVFTEGEGIPYTGVNPDAFIAEFEANGGEVVSTQTYVWAADTDFSAQVNEIAGISENNEVVFSAALGFQLTALRGQLEGQGLDGLTYAGTDALDATGIQFEANNEGIVHTPHVSITAGDRVDTLLADYEAAKGEALESRGFMPLYVDSMFLGIQGILDCGCADPAGIGDAVKQISGFEGLSGEITYAGTNGIPPKAVPINRIVDGEDVLVATIGDSIGVLEVSGLTTAYGEISALRDANLSVGSGEVVGLIGPNGAGKSTLLNTIAGLLVPRAGRVDFDGQDVSGRSPEELLRAGLALVPERRRIFVDLTVEENLRIGGVTIPASDRGELLNETAELCPVLRDKGATSAGYLSGGEAQQLAIGRALMSRPRLLMMDEPSLGLAPILVDTVFQLVEALRDQGRTLLVVEQNATRMLEVADRAYVLRSGEVVAEGTGAELRSDERLFDMFVGN